MDDDALRIKLWQGRSLRGRLSHLNALDMWLKIDFILTLFNVSCSAAVLALSAASASWPFWRVAVGLLSGLVAITSILQYVLDPRERAARHRKSTEQYLIIYRDLEDILFDGHFPVPPERLAHIRAQRDRAALDAPSVGSWTWKSLPVTKTIKDLEAQIAQSS